MRIFTEKIYVYTTILNVRIRIKITMYLVSQYSARYYFGPKRKWEMENRFLIDYIDYYLISKLHRLRKVILTLTATANWE